MIWQKKKLRISQGEKEMENKTNEAATVTIPMEEYKELLQTKERLRLLESYIQNKDYYEEKVMKALIGDVESM